jgi:hypothetical protein
MFTCKLLYEGNDAATAIARLEAARQSLPGKYYIRFYLGSAHLDLGDRRKPCTSSSGRWS